MTRKVALVMVGALVALVAIGFAVGSTGGGFRWWGAREPIYIFGDAGFTYSNGVIAGTGTQADPYVIEGWQIAPSKGDYGITIDHTTRYFVIRHCVIGQARDGAIVFNSVENGRIEGCLLVRSEAGVELVNSRYNTLSGNLILENRYGVVMVARSVDNVIAGNSFVTNGLSGIDVAGQNVWFLDGKGNYWSDYFGTDSNNDGIGDQPYYLVGDPAPLMASPVSGSDFPPCTPCVAGSAQSQNGMILVTSRTPIELRATDPGSGVAGIYFAIDDGQWMSYTQPFTLTGPDGVHRVSYYAVDRLGNREPVRTISYLLDNRPPETTIDVGSPSYKDSIGLWVTSRTLIALVAKAGSEPAGVTTFFRIDSGDWVEYRQPFSITQADGPHSLSFYSRDATGNAESVKSVTIMKDDSPPATSGTSGGLPIGPAGATGNDGTQTPSNTVQTPPQSTGN
jgi:parallel beta-helix repeat protein